MANKPKTIRVSYENYAKILKLKGKLLVDDSRPIEEREDVSENDVLTHLFLNQKEETKK